MFTFNRRPTEARAVGSDAPPPAQAARPHSHDPALIPHLSLIHI